MSFFFSKNLTQANKSYVTLKTLVQITLKNGKNIENFISHSHLRFISTGFQGVCHTSDIDQRKPPNVLSMSTTSLRK